MVKARARTVTEFLLLLATVLGCVGAQATLGASQTTSITDLPAPSVCPSTSINHIIQTLPQQCFTSAWTGRVKEEASPGSNVHELQNDTRAKFTSAGSFTSTLSTIETSASANSDRVNQQPSATGTPSISSIINHSDVKPTTNDGFQQEPDADSDSPLDNVHFLSFEEWKKQNLAKAGQSADNLGAGRSGDSEPRRRPGGINNALDSLGEDTEIEIDFAGFVGSPASPSGTANDKGNAQERDNTSSGEENKALDTRLSSTHLRSTSAGKTCKERSNYASFDCAATMLKTNPECKSATSVLVENKDSYMLNICAANNKFFIVELCNDILVDTVVLANFEFFSSIFRTFRVSVSDKYPVKLDKWRELGTFEAKNNRGLQAFLIEEPQIWAKYLRIEFLTHYGHEYYCPVSLLRVHGTTMMEEFNRELKISRGEDDSEGEVEEEVPQEPHSIHDVVTADVLRQETVTTAHGPSATTTASEPSTTQRLRSLSEKDGLEPEHGRTLIDNFSSTTPFNETSLAQLAMLLASVNNQPQTCRLDETLATTSPPPLASTMPETAPLPSSDILAKPDESSSAQSTS
ncbi:MAG: hypothetical protein Q9218_002745, partial [Villophora microphyllina]